jgi:hypothetical protein
MIVNSWKMTHTADSLQHREMRILDTNAEGAAVSANCSYHTISSKFLKLDVSVTYHTRNTDAYVT